MLFPGDSKLISQDRQLLLLLLVRLNQQITSLVLGSCATGGRLRAAPLSLRFGGRRSIVRGTLGSFLFLELPNLLLVLNQLLFELLNPFILLTRHLGRDTTICCLFRKAVLDA